MISYRHSDIFERFRKNNPPSILNIEVTITFSTDENNPFSDVQPQRDGRYHASVETNIDGSVDENLYAVDKLDNIVPGGFISNEGESFDDFFIRTRQEMEARLRKVCVPASIKTKGSRSRWVIKCRIQR